MDDPCRHCDNLEERNLYLSKHFISLSRLNGADNGELPEDLIRSYRENAQKYEHLIACAPDAIFIADAETGVILDANKRAGELIGMSVDKIVGLHQWRLHPREESEKYKQLFHDHCNSGTLTISENMCICRSDGHCIPVQINASVTQIGGKKALFGIFRDITAQKELEHQLAESERKYRELYNHAQIPLYRTRLSDGKLLECNDALVEMLGYESREKCLAECYSVHHYVNASQRSDLLSRLKSDGAVSDFELEFIRRDGTRAWTRVSAKLYPKEGYIEGAQQDITVYKVLTEMEKKILEIILAGKSNKEIAHELNRSVRTIEDHRAHIMQKLHAHNLVELVQKAQSFHSNSLD